MDETTELNPKKIRIGLAMISLFFAAALVLTAVADGAVAKSIFFAVAAITLVRAALLARWLRRRQAGLAA